MGAVAQPVLEGLKAVPEEKRWLVEGPVASGRPLGFDIRVAPFNDIAAVQRALHEVRTVFLVPKIQPEIISKHALLITAAQQAGVERIILVSLIGADHSSPIRALRWFGAIEHELALRDIPFTVLRAAPYMQSLLLFVRPHLPGQPAIFGPFRDARFPWLSACDLGEVAARLAITREQADRYYTLTGPEKLSFAEVADLVSAGSGKPFHYFDITTHEAMGHLESASLSPLKVRAITEWWDALACGMIDMPVSEDTRPLLGRDPSSMSSFIQSHLREFTDGKPASEGCDPSVTSSAGAGTRGGATG
jgi:uncharacterized protein YbjT (DUF2867 family)